MAKCTLTAKDKQRIEAIARELNVEIEEFFADARDLLDAVELEVVTSYAQACVFRALSVGSALHAVVDAQCTMPYSGRGREVFVRDALAAWTDCFTPIEQPWRLVPIFDKIPGGEKRLLADVAALEVMAANRMFSSLDDQCAELLSSD